MDNGNANECGVMIEKEQRFWSSCLAPAAPPPPGKRARNMFPSLSLSYSFFSLCIARSSL